MSMLCNETTDIDSPEFNVYLSTLDIEVWKPIPGYETKYAVSNLGRVKRIAHFVVDRHSEGFTRKRPYKERLLRPNWGKRLKKYCVKLSNVDCERKTLTVHSLVALAFLGARPDNLEVCHNNGDSRNNCLYNLRYDTSTSNSIDTTKHGNNPRLMSAKTAECIVRELPNTSNIKLARKYKVSVACVSQIRNGRTWRHIPRPAQITKRKRTMVTPEMAKEIKRLSSSGHSIKDLQTRFNVSRPTIKKYS